MFSILKKEALNARNDYTVNNNLPQLTQKYTGENGYSKGKYKEIFK